MADNTRQSIIDRIESLLSDIMIVNGYSSDLGLHIHVFHPRAVDLEQLPCCLIRDSSQTVIEKESQASYPLEERELQVDFVIFAQKEIKYSTIRSILADVERALGVDPQLSGLVILSEYVSDSIDTEQNELAVSVSTLTYKFLYRVNQYQAV